MITIFVAKWAFSRIRSIRGVIIGHQVVGLRHLHGVNVDLGQIELSVVGYEVDEEDAVIFVNVRDLTFEERIPIVNVLISPGTLVRVFCPWVSAKWVD